MIGDKLYLWGGGPHPDFPQVHNNREKRKLTSQVEIFNITSGKWDSKPTSGDPPLGIAVYNCQRQNLLFWRLVFPRFMLSQRHLST